MNRESIGKIGITKEAKRLGIERIYKFKVGDVVNGLEVTEIITDRELKEYKYKCITCGYENSKNEYDLEKYGCGCCKGSVVVEGINDIPTTDPWMIPYFQGGYDEAKQYRKSSHAKIYPICPQCGTIKNKKIMINQLYYRKDIGCICSDGISIPEKFVYHLLKSVEVEFEYQYRPEWNREKFYDFYIKDLNMIVEANGGQHYKLAKLWEDNASIPIKENDRIKREKALNNGITKYIQLDLRNSDLEWMKNSIENSELYTILNLKGFNIDYVEIFRKSLKSICVDVCKDWANIKDTQVLADKYKVARGTIIKYLHKGTQLGLCNYDSKVNRIDSLKKIKYHYNSKKILVFDGEKLIGEYNSMTDFSRKSESIVGFEVRQNLISRYVDTNKKYKGLSFRTVA